MLNETELEMFAKVGFIVAGAMFILTGLSFKRDPSDWPSLGFDISVGITFICIGLAQLGID